VYPPMTRSTRRYIFGRYYEKKNNIEIIIAKIRNQNMVIISSNNLDHYPKVGIYDNSSKK
jgi:hypothetical protein